MQNAHILHTPAMDRSTKILIYALLASPLLKPIASALGFLAGLTF